MGLAIFAIASWLFPSPQQYSQSDPEKAEHQHGLQRDRGATQAQDDPGGITPDLEGDDRPPKSRRLRRRWSTFSSAPPFKRTQTASTSASTSSWFSRVWTFIIPSDERNSDIDKFVPNYRSSPIIAGVIIPFSILLEIPGLTERWYIRTENGQTVETKPNPVLLDVAMAFSIACALIANIFLVMRFLERRVRFTTFACIFFLTIHDIINVITVTTFGLEHRKNDGFTYGESFWMSLCSTIVSSFTNMTLIYDYIRVPDFAHRGSGLTRRQRGLVIIVMILLLYIAMGALVNSLLLHLDYINGLYFTVVSLETIGFGDIAPDTTGSRVFICGYIAIGIIILGLVIALTRETILEGLEIGYRQRLRNLRMHRREARRFRRSEARWRDAVEWRLRGQGSPVWVPDLPRDEDDSNGPRRRFMGVGMPRWLDRFMGSIGWPKSPPADPSSRLGRRRPRGTHLNIQALSAEQLRSAALEAGVSPGMFANSGRKRVAQAGRAPVDDSAAVPGQPDAVVGTNWPSHSQTQTHAQVGRMAAMVTNIAAGHSGQHLDLPGFWDRQHSAGSASESDVDAGDDVAENREHAAAGREAAHEPNGGVPERRGSLADVGRYADVPEWVREFAHGEDQKFSYMRYQQAVEEGEKKAHVSKLAIAWALFFVFWFLGAGIFTATEGWSYGIAMYFCFTAFLTTGYGDYTPTTPAGRSLFVVWALFGVATMTILISILQDVGESRYKNALHSRVFSNAIKQYRKAQALETTELSRAQSQLQRNVPRASHGTFSGDGLNSLTPERVSESRIAAQRELEALPSMIIHQARTFHDYLQYFVGASGNQYTDPQNAPGTLSEDVLQELRKLLDEVAGEEHLTDRVKREILQDDDAKSTLFMLSIERALKTMTQAAENTQAALADRDSLIALQEQNNVPHARSTVSILDGQSARQHSASPPANVSHAPSAQYTTDIV